MPARPFRWLTPVRASIRRPSAAAHRPRGARLGCVALEERTVPTTNLILDFDGGGTPLAPGKSTIVNGADTVNFEPFLPFPVNGAAGNRTEQILQVVAGVRQDFADFDVRVIWD